MALTVCVTAYLTDTGTTILLFREVSTSSAL